MARETPDGCERGLDDCEALHRIVSDDRTTFICCGHSSEESRTRREDTYRLCFKNAETDTIYDHDVLDLLDTVEVIIRAVSTVMGERIHSIRRTGLRAAAPKLLVACHQARGALLLDHMIDDDGKPFGTTQVALEALDEAIALADDEPPRPPITGAT